MRAIKFALITVLTLALITVYTLRSFRPDQPLHHQLNDAGGVLIVATILVAIFFPGKRDDLD